MMVNFEYPKELNSETRHFMESVMSKLNESNAIEGCDMGGLRMLMTAYDMYRQASEILIKEGPIITDKHGEKKSNPANILTKNYYAQVLSFMKEYGLTIRSRERIKILTPPVDDNNEILNVLRENAKLG